jgi:MOSC domain-containing protein YiiM
MDCGTAACDNVPRAAGRLRRGTPGGATPPAMPPRFPPTMPDAESPSEPALGPGRVLAIAVRTRRGGPMREVPQTAARPDAGLDGDLPAGRDRGLTLIAREDWQAAIRELGADLPWHTRRANLLVEGLSMRALVGRRLRIGPVELAIVGETEPCQVMDDQHAGLRRALVPGCRGGVHGRVVRGGLIAVGDAVRVLAAAGP